MNYTFNWDSVAIDSYIEETEFILSKWNDLEVQKFQDLVGENLERLSINPSIGIYKNELKIYSLVISKQTTLYYNFNKQTKIIVLYLFWNNSKNPDDLIKLL
jgi:hypothetical protein